jgi:hypothetical protein
MNSTPTPRAVEPHDGLIARADEGTEGVAYKAMFVREEEWDKRPLHSFDQAIAAFDE